MIWSIVEDLIAITIGSVPSLKPLFVRMKWLANISTTSRRNGKKTGDYQHCESYNLDSQSKSKNQTRIITTAGESDSVKDLVQNEGNIIVSSEFRTEEEYEYHDMKPRTHV